MIPFVFGALSTEGTVADLLRGCGREPGSLEGGARLARGVESWRITGNLGEVDLTEPRPLVDGARFRSWTGESEEVAPGLPEPVNPLAVATLACMSAAWCVPRRGLRLSGPLVASVDAEGVALVCEADSRDRSLRLTVGRLR